MPSPPRSRKARKNSSQIPSPREERHVGLLTKGKKAKLKLRSFHNEKIHLLHSGEPMHNAAITNPTPVIFSLLTNSTVARNVTVVTGGSDLAGVLGVDQCKDWLRARRQSPCPTHQESWRSSSAEYEGVLLPSSSWTMEEEPGRAEASVFDGGLLGGGSEEGPSLVISGWNAENQHLPKLATMPVAPTLEDDAKHQISGAGAGVGRGNLRTSSSIQEVCLRIRLLFVQAVLVLEWWWSIHLFQYAPLHRVEHLSSVFSGHRAVGVLVVLPTLCWEHQWAKYMILFIFGLMTSPATGGGSTVEYLNDTKIVKTEHTSPIVREESSNIFPPGPEQDEL